MRSDMQSTTPILDKLIRDGVAWREDNDVVGSLGSDYASAERYLQTHPTPETW